MSNFESLSMPKHNLMRIVLRRNGPDVDWNEISDFYRRNAEEGIANWELDLREITFINSLTIGNLIALNTSAKSRGGSFRVLVEKESSIAQLLRLTKLNLILEVMENVFV